LSDIFAASVERLAGGKSIEDTWLIGEDVALAGDPFRDMSGELAHVTNESIDTASRFLLTSFPSTDPALYFDGHDYYPGIDELHPHYSMMSTQRLEYPNCALLTFVDRYKGDGDDGGIHVKYVPS
jgi:hypothetical protein